MDILHELHEQGNTVVLITHDNDIARQKKLRYFSRSSFKPVHCIGFLSSIVLGVCTSVFMMLWQRGGQAQKQKQPHPKRDEAV